MRYDIESNQGRNAATPTDKQVASATLPAMLQQGLALPRDLLLAPLQAIDDRQTECVKLLGTDGSLRWMNRAGLALLGAPSIAAVNNHGLLNFVHREDRQLFLDFHESICAGNSGDLHFRVLRADGQIRHVKTTSTAFVDPIDQCRFHLGVSRDVTESVVALAAAAQSERRLALVLGQAGIGEWTLNLADNGVARSLQHDQCFGYTDLQASWSWDTTVAHIHADDRQRTCSALAAAIVGNAEIDEEIRVIWPNGSPHWIWIRAAAEHDDNGKARCLTGIVADITARKDAEVQVQLSERRWKFAMEGSGDGVWDWDIDSNRVTYSPRWAEILGFDVLQMSDAPSEWTERVHPDDYAAVMCSFKQHLEGWTPKYLAEYRLRCADGSWKWVRGRGIVVARDGHGRALRMIGTYTDIDEIKKDAERIENLRQRLSLAIKGSGFGVWELDLATGRLIWDEQMHDIYGYACDSFDGSPETWKACLHANDRDLVNARFQDLLDGKVVDLFEFRIFRAVDGSERRIEANGYLQRDIDGTPQRLVGMNRDVSERWQAQLQIRLLGASLAQLHDMVLIAEQRPHASAQIIYANQPFYERTGFSSADLGELREFLRGDSDDETLRRFVLAMANKKHMRAEILLRCKDDSALWVELDIVPAIDESDLVTHWVLIAHDIGDRKAAELAILEANAELERRVCARTMRLHSSNQDLQAFTYSVSHDLRAPLRGIEGWSQALDEDCGHLLNEVGHAHLRRIRSEAKRMGDLVAGLLRLSRIAQADIANAEVDISTIAQSVVERLCEEQPQRQVKIDLQANMRVYGDRPLLMAALSNLLENAWKFTAKREDAHIAVRAYPLEKQIVVEIADNGVGFDMALYGELFQPFKRLHRASEFPGSGLGLAMVESIVRRHQGRVEAKSILGEGATFLIHFPAIT